MGCTGVLGAVAVNQIRLPGFSLAFREPRPDRAYPSVFHVLAAVGSTLKPCAGRAQRFWRRLARHIIVLQGSHPRHQSMLFAASHAQPDSETACGHRQTDRQRNARPKPRTTKGVVWRTDTQLISALHLSGLLAAYPPTILPVCFLLVFCSGQLPDLRTYPS